MSIAGHFEAMRVVLGKADLELDGALDEPITEGDTVALLHVVPIQGGGSTAGVYAVGPVVGDFRVFRRWFDDVVAEIWRLNQELELDGRPIEWGRILITDQDAVTEQHPLRRAMFGIMHRDILEELPARHPLMRSDRLAEVDQVTVCGHPVRGAGQLARVRRPKAPDQ